MKTNRVRGNSSAERKRQRKVYDTAQLPDVWIPADGLRALTATERSWLLMSAEVECIRGATVNTVYNFRTQKSELTNNTDNSAIKVTRYSRQGERGEESNTVFYAWIVDMFVHRLCPESDELVVCEGDWPDLLPGKSVVGLPVVREILGGTSTQTVHLLHWLIVNLTIWRCFLIHLLMLTALSSLCLIGGTSRAHY